MVVAVQEWDEFSLWVIDLFAPLVRWFGSLSIIGDYTYLKILGIADPILDPYAQATGFELSVFKFLICLFLAYPFSAILYHLPTPALKHACSFLTGLFFVQWIFAADWIHTFISSFGTYFICALLPQKYIGWVSFLWVMGYLIVCHIYTMQVRYLSEEFDFLRTQMVITMKLTSFAYNLYDGTYDAERVLRTETITPPMSEKDKKIYRSRRRFAIQSFPTLLEFLGYVYCFPCILVGPAFEYNDYIKPINGEAYHLPSDEKDPQKMKKSSVKKPATLLPAAQRLLIGVFFMLLYLYFIPMCDIVNHYQSRFIEETSPVTRLVLCYLALLVQRFKFYFAWKVAEGSAILAGFGFEGYSSTGEIKGWRGVENIDIIGVETASSIQATTRYWNKRTQGWLERYTYLRTNRSLLAIYTVSAIWHGLYPGYFFAFLTMPLPTNIERLIKEKINPLVVPEYDGYDYRTYPSQTLRGRLYELVCWLGTWSSMVYSMQVFYMISMERTMLCWRGYYFIGHLVMAVVYLALSAMPAPHKRDNHNRNRKNKTD